jgi:NTP pyrophosphatase (non-canonical NTP hydrolase)
MPKTARRKTVKTDRLDALVRDVAAFNSERDWKQFHAPKNLTMALAIEAAELMEPFRWMTPEDSWRAARDGEAAAKLREELADVMLLSMSLASYLELDLVEITRAKLERNRERYPAEKARGKADKYTAYAAGKKRR